MKMKEENEKAGLKLNVQKKKIMASGPITSWQIEEGKMEAVTDFVFLGSKSLQMVTAAMKLRCLLLKESYDNTRQCIKKERHHFC